MDKFQKESSNANLSQVSQMKVKIELDFKKCKTVKSTDMKIEMSIEFKDSTANNQSLEDKDIGFNNKRLKTNVESDIISKVFNENFIKDILNSNPIKTTNNSNYKNHTKNVNKKFLKSNTFSNGLLNKLKLKNLKYPFTLEDKKDSYLKNINDNEFKEYSNNKDCKESLDFNYDCKDNYNDSNLYDDEASKKSEDIKLKVRHSIEKKEDKSYITNDNKLNQFLTFENVNEENSFENNRVNNCNVAERNSIEYDPLATLTTQRISSKDLEEIREIDFEQLKHQNTDDSININLTKSANKDQLLDYHLNEKKLINTNTHKDKFDNYIKISDVDICFPKIGNTIDDQSQFSYKNKNESFSQNKVQNTSNLNNFKIEENESEKCNLELKHFDSCNQNKVDNLNDKEDNNFSKSLNYGNTYTESKFKSNLITKSPASKNWNVLINIAQAINKLGKIDARKISDVDELDGEFESFKEKRKKSYKYSTPINKSPIKIENSIKKCVHKKGIEVNDKILPSRKGTDICNETDIKALNKDELQNIIQEISSFRENPNETLNQIKVKNIKQFENDLSNKNNPLNALDLSLLSKSNNDENKIHEVNSINKENKQISQKIINTENTEMAMTKIYCSEKLYQYISQGNPEDLQRVIKYFNTDPKAHLKKTKNEKLINQKLNQDFYPLHLATLNGHLHYVIELIKADANYLLKNKNESILDICIRWNHIKVLEYLLDKLDWPLDYLLEAKKVYEKYKSNKIMKEMLVKKINSTKKKKCFCF